MNDVSGNGETRVRLCGELAGVVDGRPLEGALRGRQGRLLFAYLLLNRDRAVTRGELVDSLWGETPPESCAATLNSLLSRLRSGLGAGVLPGRSALRLVLAETAWIDVEVARADVAQARAALEAGSPADAIPRAREALELLEQGLLVDLDTPWLDEHRRELDDVVLDALECLASAAAALGAPHAADSERAARALIDRAPYRETGYKLLMEALARRGNVAEALRVYEQCRAFLGEELGATPGPGLRALHERLLSERDLPSPVAPRDQPRERAALRLPPALQAPGPYVGRGVERERLTQLWDDARRGRRSVALIAGEPGIGKTRLCGDVAASVLGDGGAVLYGRCDEELRVPYRPWVDALTEAVAAASEDTLRAHAADHGGELARLAPGLGRLQGAVRAQDERDPETERYALFEAVVGFLSRVSLERPVLLVLDDLHAADKPTLLLLRHLAAAGAEMRVLILATYRSSEVARSGPLLETLADLGRHADVERLELGGLEEVEVAALMEAATGDELDAAGLDLAAEVWRETDGNPFFVNEIVRHLREAGAIAPGDDGRWVVMGSLAELGLPHTVREVIALRVARLDADPVGVLSAAAVIGREFDLDLLAPVSGRSEDELLELLDSAVEAALLTEIPRVPGRFSFAHALIGHTLYANLGPTRRARLHRRVAEALEQLAGEDPGPLLPELARHWSAPGVNDPMRSIDYGRRAAARALDNLAPDEAVRWSTRALSLADEHFGADERLRCDLLIELGEAQRQAGAPQHRETLLEAGRLARRLSDPDRLFRAAVANNRHIYAAFGGVDEERLELFEATLDALSEDDHRRRAHVLALVAAERAWHRDSATRRRVAEQAIELARTAADSRTLGVVLQATNLPLWEPDTVDMRRRHAAEGVAIAAELGAPRIHWWAAYQEQIAAFEADDLPASERALREMRRLADEIGQPSLDWLTTHTEAGMLTLRGFLEKAEALAERAAASGEREALPVYIAQLGMIRLQQGRMRELEEPFRQASERAPEIPGFSAAHVLTLLEDGRGDEARPIVNRLVAEELTTAPWGGRAPAIAQLAIACAELDDRDAARLIHPHVVPWAHLIAYNNVVNFASWSLYAGMLERLLERYDEAERHLLRAAKVNERIRAPYFLARTHLEIARLHGERGQDGDRARPGDHVELAVDLAREYGFAGLERKARALAAA